jgi:hypothetical protein
MTKLEAIQARNARRAQGEDVIAVKVEGIYTIPFRGITSFVRYEVRTR